MARAMFASLVLSLTIIPTGVGAVDYKLEETAKPEWWSPNQDRAYNAAQSMCVLNIHTGCSRMGGTITGIIRYTGKRGVVYCDLKKTGTREEWKCSAFCNAVCRVHGL